MGHPHATGSAGGPDWWLTGHL